MQKAFHKRIFIISEEYILCAVFLMDKINK